MATAQRIAFLRGHEDAVVCLAVTPDSQLVASGAEDGAVCVHDVATSQLLCRLQCSDDDTAVGAVVWHPKPLPVHTLTQQPGSSSSTAANVGACGSGRLLFAGVGQELLVLLLLPADGSSSSSSSSSSSGAGSNGDSHAQVQQAAESTAGPAAAAGGGDVAAAAGAAPVVGSGLQLVVVLRQVVSHDDISALAVNTPGTHLSVADDTGDVVLFDIQKLQQQLHDLHTQPQQQQQQQQLSLQPCRTIAGAHDPMATAVGFRGPHKPWQLLSGGVDSRVALWDFSRPKKCCGSWNMQHMAGQVPTVNPAAAAAAAVNTAGDKGSSSSSSRNGDMEGRSTTQQEGQLWNPPMVHSLALPWALPQQQQQQQKPAGQPTATTAAAAGSGDASVPAVPAAVLKRLVAAARGDGVIAVFDADPDAKPLARHQQQHQQQQQQLPSGSSRVGGKGSKGGRSRGRTGSVQQDGPGSSSSSSSGSGSVPQQEQQQVLQEQQQQQLSEVPAGFHVCLGASMGGHTLPAAAVAFLPWGGGGRYLCSGGQDGKVLLWDWLAAFAAAHSDPSYSDEHRENSAHTGDGNSAGGIAAGGISAAPAATEAAAAAVTAAGAATAGPLPADTHQADSSAAAAAKPSSSTSADAVVPAVQKHSTCLLLSVNHKRKVNALCCCWAPHGPTAPPQANGASAAATAAPAPAAASVGQRGKAPVLLLVADTASRISVYMIRL